MPARLFLSSPSTAAGAMEVGLAGAALMAAGVPADFTVGVVAGSTVEAEAFTAEAEAVFTVAEEVSVGDMDHRQPVMEPRMLRRLCDQAADTRRGRVMAIQIIHAPAAALPVEISDTEVLPLHRRLPMADGIRFPVRAGIEARQARNRKQHPRQLRADCTFLAATAQPDLPGRLGVFQARATKFGKTRRALGT